MTQTAARAQDDHVGAGFGVCLAQRGVDCHACAQQRRSGRRVEVLGDGRDVVCGPEGVLLEGAGGVVARDFLSRRQSVGSDAGLKCTHAVEAACVHAGTARLTCFADASHPFDTDSVADLDSRVLGARTHLHDLADALVAADLACLCGEWEGLPGIEHDAQIGVADARVRPGQDVSCLFEASKEQYG